MENIGSNILVFILVILVLLLILSLLHTGLWLSARMSGLNISLLRIIQMRLRRVPPSEIIMAMAMTNRVGLKLDIRDLEEHHRARGNVNNVAKALVYARQSNITLDFRTAATIDLAGRDVIKEVQNSANQIFTNTSWANSITKDKNN